MCSQKTVSIFPILIFVILFYSIQVRLLGDTVEAQAKMSKTIETLSKTFAAKPAKTTKPPPTSLAATLKMIQKDDNNANKKTNENEVSEAVVRQENIDLADIFERQKTESGIVELRWANNLMLIGDDLWLVQSRVFIRLVKQYQTGSWVCGDNIDI